MGSISFRKSHRRLSISFVFHVRGNPHIGLKTGDHIDNLSGYDIENKYIHCILLWTEGMAQISGPGSRRRISPGESEGAAP